LTIIEDKNKRKNKNIIEINSKDKDLIMLNSFLNINLLINIIPTILIHQVLSVKIEAHFITNILVMANK
jgi:hypothetical protein